MQKNKTYSFLLMKMKTVNETVRHLRGLYLGAGISATSVPFLFPHPTLLLLPITSIPPPSPKEKVNHLRRPETNNSPISSEVWDSDGNAPAVTTNSGMSKTITNPKWRTRTQIFCSILFGLF